MISVFVGLGYVGYRKSPFGRSRKAKSIVDKVLTFHKASTKKWEFPNELVKSTESELSALNYHQLELVLDYVKDKLQKKDNPIIQKHQKALKENKVNWTTDLKHLEDMLFNTTTTMKLNRYSKSAIATPVTFKK